VRRRWCCWLGAAGQEGLQALEEDAVTVFGEQAEADDEPDDQPEGQDRAVTGGAAGLCQDPLNGGRGDDTLQGGDALLGGLVLQQAKQRASGHESLLGRWLFEQHHFARRLSPCPCLIPTYDYINVCRSERYWA
jgi:hypothetical protein